MNASAILLSVVLLAAAGWILAPRRRRPSPPGPRGLPLLGNLLQLPRQFTFLQLHVWSRQYGGCYSLNLAGQEVVVLASVKAAADVLDRMSAPTAGRPRMIKMNQFLCRGDNLVGEPHGEKWRRLRRATHEVLNVRSVAGFQPLQEQEAAIMISTMLNDPNVALDRHFHRTSSSIAWRVLYGGDPLPLSSHGPVERVEELATDVFKAGMPGNSLMDIFPPLRHVYAHSKWLRRHLDDWYEEATAIFLDLYTGSHSAAVLGNPCVSNNLSRLPEDYGINETTKAWTAGVLLTAGQDTTASVLRFFALAMLLHPDVARRAQQELDDVVADRMPTFQDRDRLHYISAVIKEVNRWRPAAPSGAPHMALEDIEYNGYVIRKGTWLLDNVWSQTHDPAVYPNPDKFDPSRFIDSDGRLMHGQADTHDDGLVFGHGRRVCPGRDLAQNSLFITCAVLLWAFEFHPPQGADGKAAFVDDMNLVDNFAIVQPVPFDVRLVPRFRNLESKLKPYIHTT